MLTLFNWSSIRLWKAKRNSQQRLSLQIQTIAKNATTLQESLSLWIMLPYSVIEDTGFEQRVKWAWITLRCAFTCTYSSVWPVLEAAVQKLPTLGILMMLHYRYILFRCHFLLFNDIMPVLKGLWSHRIMAHEPPFNVHTVHNKWQKHFPTVAKMKHRNISSLQTVKLSWFMKLSQCLTFLKREFQRDRFGSGTTDENWQLTNRAEGVIEICLEALKFPCKIQ